MEDDIINKISNEEAIDKLSAINTSVDTLAESINKNSTDSQQVTLATNVVAGHIVSLKNQLSEDSEKTKKVNGTVQITAGSIDTLTERFTSRIKEVTKEAEKANKESLVQVQSQAKELIKTMQAEMEGMSKNLLNGINEGNEIASKRVQGVVLVDADSMKRNSRLKSRDLYNAKGGGGGGSISTDYSHSRNSVLYDDAGTVSQGFQVVTYQNNGETSREIQDLTGAVVAGATVVAHTATETEHTILRDKTDDTLVLVEYPYINGARQPATYTVISTGVAFAGNVTDLVGAEDDISWSQTSASVYRDGTNAYFSAYDVVEHDVSAGTHTVVSTVWKDSTGAVVTAPTGVSLTETDDKQWQITYLGIYHEGTTNYHKTVETKYDLSTNVKAESVVWFDEAGARITAPAAPIYGEYVAPAVVYDTPTMVSVPVSSTVNVANWKSISVKGKGDAGVTVTVGAAVTTLDEDEELNWSVDDVSTVAVDITTTAATTARILTVID